MRKVMFCLAVMVIGAAALNAQTATLSSPDANKTDAHDRPIGTVRLKLPLGSGNPGGSGQLPPPPPPPPEVTPPGGEDIPPIEVPPDPPPPEEDPPYWEEPVQSKVVFILDASGSMGGSRVATLRAETTTTIGLLDEDHEFDCVAFGDQFGPAQHYSKFMWGTLLPATEGNKTAAISWVNGPSTNPGGGTPTYACLKRSCEVYPADLEQMFLVSDGWPNTSGSASQILADFPGWWAKFTDCELVCVCIGGGGADFMQNLAALAGGRYIAV